MKNRTNLSLMRLLPVIAAGFSLLLITFFAPIQADASDQPFFANGSEASDSEVSAFQDEGSNLESESSTAIEPAKTEEYSFENESMSVRVQGPSFDGTAELFADGIWITPGESGPAASFTLSFLSEERTAESQESRNVDLLIKGFSLGGHEYELLHRLDKESVKKEDALITEDQSGVHVQFETNSFSEFLLHPVLERSSPMLELYNLAGELSVRQEMSSNSTFILPFEPPGIPPSTGRFIGWSTSPQYIQNGDAWKTHPLYEPGSTLIWNESMGAYGPYRLYPIWAPGGADTWGDYFIRLDGTIPNEPVSLPASLYTAKIPVYGAMNYIGPMVSSAGIGSGPGQKLAREPSASQLADVINPKASQIGYGAREAGGVLYKTLRVNGSWQIVDAAGRPAALDENGIPAASAVRLSVLWYVVKKEGYNWHIDGVLLESSQYSLIYTVGNAGTGEVSNMPNGLALAPNTEVVVGTDRNLVHSTPITPVRAGYLFLGWQNRKNGTLYQPGDSFEITEDTVLEALWKPDAGNSFSLNKSDSQAGKRLANAVFMLESKEPGGEWSIDSAMLRTLSNGTLTYDGLSTGKIYRLSETEAPKGFMPVSPFCFTITNQQGELQGFLCDENGSRIEDPAGILSVLQAGGNLFLDFKIGNDPYLSTLKIQKRDVRGNPLSGARFEIMQLEGDTFAKIASGLSSESGQVYFDLEDGITLRDGVYEIDELIPPDGYSTEPNVRIIVENGQIRLAQEGSAGFSQTEDYTLITITDHPGPILPETGSLQRLLAAAGSAAAFALGAYLLIYKTRTVERNAK